MGRGVCPEYLWTGVGYSKRKHCTYKRMQSFIRVKLGRLKKIFCFRTKTRRKKKRESEKSVLLS